jgi:hypothetical protein
MIRFTEGFLIEKSIWKFPLSGESCDLIEMPKGAVTLSVQTQRGEICIWALVNPNAETEKRLFVTVGTGRSISLSTGIYIGTVQTSDGFFVWHVFDCGVHQ